MQEYLFSLLFCLGVILVCVLPKKDENTLQSVVLNNLLNRHFYLCRNRYLWDRLIEKITKGLLLTKWKDGSSFSYHYCGLVLSVSKVNITLSELTCPLTSGSSLGSHKCSKLCKSMHRRDREGIETTYYVGSLICTHPYIIHLCRGNVLKIHTLVIKHLLNDAFVLLYL